MKRWFRKHVFEILDSLNEPPIIHSNKRHLGIFATLTGYLLYSVYTVNYQDFSFQNTGAHKNYVVFFEASIFYLVMFGCFFLSCFLKGKSYFKCKKPRLIFARGVVGVLLLLSYSLARTWTSDVDNSMLYSTDAFWLVLLLAFLGIKSRFLVWVGVVIGFVSIALVWYFDSNSIRDFVGGGLGTLSGILLAIITFITRYIVRRDPPLRIALYNSLIGVVGFSVITCFYGFKYGWYLPSLSFIPIAILNGMAWSLALFFFLEAFYTTETYVIGAISLILPFFVETLNWANNQEAIQWKTLLVTFASSLGAIIVIWSSYKEDNEISKHKKSKQYKVPETIDEDEEFEDG